jgi:pimeloyl-ACP methyl ester carboxylesterase
MSAIYYRLYNKQEKIPIVLIHGAGGTHLVWPPQIRRLAGYRVYAIDLPGHGRSAGPGQRDILSYARHVMDWLVEIGLCQVALLGHSMGSAIAMRIALDHPDTVLGLGLLGSAANLRVNPRLLGAASGPDTFLEAVEKVTAWSYSEETPSWIPALAARRMAETRPDVLYADFLACDRFDITDRLSELSQPALVLCGEQDRMTTQRGAQFLAEHLPAGRLEIIPHAGHMLMIEQPQAVADVLQNFLSGIS